MMIMIMIMIMIISSTIIISRTRAVGVTHLVEVCGEEVGGTPEVVLQPLLERQQRHVEARCVLKGARHHVLQHARRGRRAHCLPPVFPLGITIITAVAAAAAAANTTTAGVSGIILITGGSDIIGSGSGGGGGVSSRISSVGIQPASTGAQQ